MNDSLENKVSREDTRLNTSGPAERDKTGFDPTLTKGEDQTSLLTRDNLGKVTQGSLKPSCLAGRRPDPPKTVRGKRGPGLGPDVSLASLPSQVVLQKQLTSPLTAFH